MDEIGNCDASCVVRRAGHEIENTFVAFAKFKKIERRALCGVP